MFFLISGGAASGKTTAARLLPEYLEQVVCHDADEIPAVDGPTRCANLETWVRRALEAQQRGLDFLLTAHSPLGELLACPSAPELAGIAACLLDCADPVRIDRIRARGVDPRWPPGQHTLSWASWHRMHARDPQWEPQVIEENGPPSHHYHRWRGWTSDDPRWQVLVLDTTEWTEQQTIDALIDWAKLARTKPALLSPTTRWWEADHR
jgi:hypothetical protein